MLVADGGTLASFDLAFEPPDHCCVDEPEQLVADELEHERPRQREEPARFVRTARSQTPQVGVAHGKSFVHLQHDAPPGSVRGRDVSVTLVLTRLEAL